MVFLLLLVMGVLGVMTYGPIAAWLVELFPPRIRYTSMSLPYHLGNGWFGGFLPSIAFAMIAYTGNIYSGLWYPADRVPDDGRRRHVLPARDQRRRSDRLISRSFLLRVDQRVRRRHQQVLRAFLAEHLRAGKCAVDEQHDLVGDLAGSRTPIFSTSARKRRRSSSITSRATRRPGCWSSANSTVTFMKGQPRYFGLLTNFAMPASCARNCSRGSGGLRWAV